MKKVFIFLGALSLCTLFSMSVFSKQNVNNEQETSSNSSISLLLQDTSDTIINNQKEDDNKNTKTVELINKFEFLDKKIIENPVSAWLMFLLIILLSFIIRKFISKQIISIILRGLNRKKVEIDFQTKLIHLLNKSYSFTLI